MRPINDLAITKGRGTLKKRALTIQKGISTVPPVLVISSLLLKIEDSKSKIGRSEQRILYSSPKNTHFTLFYFPGSFAIRRIYIQIP